MLVRGGQQKETAWFFLHLISIFFFHPSSSAIKKHFCLFWSVAELKWHIDPCTVLCARCAGTHSCLNSLQTQVFKVGCIWMTKSLKNLLLKNIYLHIFFFSIWRRRGKKKKTKKEKKEVMSLSYHSLSGLLANVLNPIWHVKVDVRVFFSCYSKRAPFPWLSIL